MSIDLKVGSIISMDGVNGLEGSTKICLSRELQFEDIYLTDSEDFWQDQEINTDSQLFEYVILSEPLSTMEVSMSDGLPIQSTSVENVLSDGAHSALRFEEDSYDQISVNHNGRHTPEDMTMEDQSMCLSSVELPTLDDFTSAAVSLPCDVIMEDESSNTGNSSVHQSAGAVVRNVNEIRNTLDVGAVQACTVQSVPQDMSTIKDRLVSQFPNIDPLNLAKAKRSCDNTKMFVRSSTDTKTKQLCCPFCLKRFSKLARHLGTMHKNEKDVKKFMSLPKGSKERHTVQTSLRKVGGHIWNSDAELNKGELIPSRRPIGDSVQDATGWTTCPFCFGSYTKNNLRHHVAGCNNNLVKNQRILKGLATIAEARINENASTRLVNAMGFMRDDEIVRLVRFDWLLIVFGNKMCCKYTPHYQENMIRARLRLTGRVLAEMKKIDNNVTDFASIYHVERYNSLVSAIRIIGRFDPLTSEFGAPAMASFAVTSVKLIGKYLSAEYIRLRDRENKIETEDFLSYMNSDIAISINKLVAETQSKMRRRKQQNIPTTEDVKKLICHINSERNVCYEALSKTFSYENWLQLAELSVAWIIVFNRRRIGEVQNILLDEFLVRQSIDDDSNEQALATLSTDARAVARKFKRMKIRGKKGRTVPVLLKPGIDKGIQLLISHRQKAGVQTGSQFLFELPSSSNLRIRVVDACRVLRELSVSCGANNPTSLRGTNLRKHMATTCVSLELNDALVAEVAKFMGHHEKIHRECYQQNPIDREVVQMAELLEAAAGKCDMDGDDDDNLGLGNGGFIDVGNESPINVHLVPNVHIATDMVVDDLHDLHGEGENGVTKVDGGTGKKKCTKVRWTNQEISSVRVAFATHFRNLTLPTQSEIEERQGDEAYAALRSRTWQQIKAYVNNQQKKKRCE